MLTPVRIPLVAGKKMANILKKLPSGPLQSGTRFAMKVSPGDGQQNSLLFSDISRKHITVCVRLNLMMT